MHLCSYEYCRTVLITVLLLYLFLQGTLGVKVVEGKKRVNKGSHVVLMQFVLHLLMRVKISMLAITMTVTVMMMMMMRCTLVQVMMKKKKITLLLKEQLLLLMPNPAECCDGHDAELDD